MGISMSNVTPLNAAVAEHREMAAENLAWIDALRDLLQESRVAALVVRGISSNGDSIEFSLTPVGARTLLHVMVGMLSEAQQDTLRALAGED